jgi:aspartyl-tRNA(Asn)/glutamyl-tRNA(Gln) amidotransferase subunit C
MADAVSIEDVRHVALLARLGLTDEAARALTHDLNTILGHMEVLARVETSGVAEYTASAQGMPLRDDHGPAVALERSPASFAPGMRDGLIIVPRLSTHEDPESAA